MPRLLDLLMANGLTPADLGSLRIGRGETLMRQGAESEAVYFVLAGRFRAERDGTPIGWIEPGSVVGEIGFFTGGPRTATVTAFRDSLVLRLTRGEYDEHCARFPGFRDAIIAELASRFAERFAFPGTTQADRVRPRTVTLLMAGAGTVPDGVANRLADALRRLCSVRLIPFETFAAEMAGADPDSTEGVDWFSRTERTADLIVYLPDPDRDAWQRAIVRQSDQVLVIGHTRRPPPLSPIEAFALDQIPETHRRLVLLHRVRRPSVIGTREWLQTRPAAMHHHVALSDNADFDRLARFVTGRAVGLVLAGGGALGLAHVGVHDALSRAGVGFDICGGTSVGGAMAAAIATGIAGEDLAHRARDIFVRGGALRRLTMPRYALLDHKTLDAKLAEHFTDVDIADLWLPWYAVATDLNTNRLEVIRTGPLWEAIRASSSLPGILPPFIRRDGALLVDGGLLDNLPYRTMHAIKSGPNVVVSLARERIVSTSYAYHRIPGRTGMVIDMLRPGSWSAPPAPGMPETIMRSMLAGRSNHMDALGPQDWLLSPPLPADLGFMNWKGAFSLIETAADHARQGFAALARTDPDLRSALLAAGPKAAS